jgi:hypothetical protein
MYKIHANIYNHTYITYTHTHTHTNIHTHTRTQYTGVLSEVEGSVQLTS